jgi:HPt (histidine-containing phosphotransfer) domain-containing protein
MSKHRQARAVGAEIEVDGLLSSSLAKDPNFKQLVESFADELPQRLAALEQAVAQADVKRVRRLIHQLKGTAGSFGFAAISELASAAERQNCDLTRVREILERLAESLRTRSEHPGHTS